MSYSKNYAFDAAPGLSKREPALAALTSSGYVGTQHDQLAATATDAMLIANIESIVTNGGTGETYDFIIVGSNIADRSDGVILGSAKTGKASVIGTPETVDGIATHRIVVPFRTEKNRKKYRYIDLYLKVAGTAPSIAFNAYLSKEIS